MVRAKKLEKPAISGRPDEYGVDLVTRGVSKEFRRYSLTLFEVARILVNRTRKRGQSVMAPVLAHASGYEKSSLTLGLPKVPLINAIAQLQNTRFG